MTDVKPDVAFKILFLIINNTNIDFQPQDLSWKLYTTQNVLLTIKKIKLIGKKEFIVAVFDIKYKVFVVHIATLSTNSSNKIHLLIKV